MRGSINHGALVGSTGPATRRCERATRVGDTVQAHSVQKMRVLARLTCKGVG
jgi:hypothetical protein